MFEFLPPWFQIFFFSMIPWLEARYVIPFALASGWDWWQAFPLSVAGNMLPVPFILLFFHLVEKFLRKYKAWAGFMDRLFAYTRKRANNKIKRYEFWGLLFFVALPVPFTGAWTGSLIAYLFDLRFFKSLLSIFLGVLIAASIMTVITLLGIDLFYIYLGVILIAILMTIFMIIGVLKIRKSSRRTRL
ncbi:MAG: small multi-drug export protein [Methanobacteriota archaeon]